MACPILVRLMVLLLGGCPARAQEASPRIVAHYFQEWNGTCENAALEPTRGWYNNMDSSGSIRLIRAQAEEARSYGISAFAISWSGRSNLRGDFLVRSVFIPALEGLREPFDWMMTFDSQHWARLHHFSYKADGLDVINLDSSQRSAITTRSVKDQMVADLSHLCRRYARHPRYFRIDGRPVVFLRGYWRWLGLMGYAVWEAESECQKALGIAPYFVGDIDLGPRMFSRYRAPFFFDAKVKIIDAFSDYTLFGGYGLDAEADSVQRFVEDSAWPCEGNRGSCRKDRTRLRQALLNADDLSVKTGKRFLPGLIAQSFEVIRAPSSCGSMSRRPEAGYMPLARGEGAQEAGRLALRRLFEGFRSVSPTPRVLFVSSWNDPGEGTSVEPSRGLNPEGAVLGRDFLEALKGLQGQPGSLPSPADPSLPLENVSTPRLKDFAEAEACYQRGLRFYTQGDLLEAAKQWREAQRLNPEDPRTQKDLKRLLDELGAGAPRPQSSR